MGTKVMPKQVQNNGKGATKKVQKLEYFLKFSFL